MIPDEYLSLFKTALNVIEVIDIIAWLFVALGILMVISGFVWIAYRKKLLCFSNVTLRKVSTTKVKVDPNRFELTEPITEMYFNSTVLYPSLYPQLEDKDINDKLIRRNNLFNLKQNASQWTN